MGAAPRRHRAAHPDEQLFETPGELAQSDGLGLQSAPGELVDRRRPAQSVFRYLREDAVHERGCSP